MQNIAAFVWNPRVNLTDCAWELTRGMQGILWCGIMANNSPHWTEIKICIQVKTNKQTGYTITTFCALSRANLLQCIICVSNLRKVILDTVKGNITLSLGFLRQPQCSLERARSKRTKTKPSYILLEMKLCLTLAGHVPYARNCTCWRFSKELNFNP